MAGKKRGNAKASRKRQSSERSGLIEEVSTSSDKSGETRSDSDSERLNIDYIYLLFISL